MACVTALAALAAIQTTVAVAAQDSMKRSSAGYEVTLRLPAEGLFANEEVQVEFRIDDKRDPQESRPVRFARVRAIVDMPGMPGMGRFEEIAHGEGVPGEYGVHPTFAHGGTYRLTLALLSPDQQPPTMSPLNDRSFTVQFTLEVGDALPAEKLKNRTFVKRYGLSVATPSGMKAGVPAVLELAVHDHFAQPVVPNGTLRLVDRPVEEFDALHEKLLHLFIVRDDLGTFAHEHPIAIGKGLFQLQFTFPTPGTYRLFADVAPRNAGSQILMSELTIAGEAPKRLDLAQVFSAQTRPVTRVDDIDVEWNWPTPLPIKQSVVVAARLRLQDGSPVADLRPYLGVMGHLMLLHEDGVTFVHCHPDERQQAVPGATVVPFAARFPKTGLFRGWAQFNRGGRVLTVDFVVRAE